MSKQVKKIKHKKLSEFEIYASFLALPSDKRREVFDFDTDIGFATKYKMANETLSRWKTDPKLWELRDTHIIQFKQYTANVLRYLYAGMSEKKSAAEAMAWFRLVESYKDKEEHSGVISIPEIERLSSEIRKIAEN